MKLVDSLLMKEAWIWTTTTKREDSKIQAMGMKFFRPILNENIEGQDKKYWNKIGTRDKLNDKWHLKEQIKMVWIHDADERREDT